MSLSRTSLQSQHSFSNAACARNTTQRGSGRVMAICITLFTTKSKPALTRSTLSHIADWRATMAATVLIHTQLMTTPSCHVNDRRSRGIGAPIQQSPLTHSKCTAPTPRSRHTVPASALVRIEAHTDLAEGNTDNVIIHVFTAAIRLR